MGIKNKFIVSSIWILLPILKIYQFGTVKGCSEIANIHITCSRLQLNKYDFISKEEMHFECQHKDKDTPIIVTVPNSKASSVKFSNGTMIQDVSIPFLVIEYSKISFIPDEIATIFPQLKVLYIKNSGVFTLSKSNLEQFGELLEIVSFDGNELTSLDADLFDANPNLKAIYLAWNPIMYIEPDFFKFKETPDLQFVNLNDLKCMSASYTGGDIATKNWENTNCLNKASPPSNVESILRELNGRTMHSLDNSFCLEQTFEKYSNELTNIQKVIKKNSCYVEKNLKSIMETLATLVTTIQKSTNSEKR